MSSYEVRAIKFIKQIFDYISDCESINDYENAINRFNYTHNRKVSCSHGMTRVAIMSSDYVIKIDYNPINVARWGCGEQERKFYELAFREGMSYLFAKIKPYYHRGRVFYIMPRISGVGRTDWDADEYLTAEEIDWCWDHDLHDLHCHNYGWKNNHVVIIDYGANGYR